MQKQDIYAIYGSDAKTMVQQLLDRVRPEKGLALDSRIGIKPNLVVAKTADSGATTTPELVAGIIEYFQTRGFHRISILESSWIGERTSRAFTACGYDKLARKYQVQLHNLEKDKSRKVRAGGLELEICEKALQQDFFINVPVLKGHCQTRLTCALKNLKGCIPDIEKRRYHTLGLHEPIACLNVALPQDLIIVDGLNGDLSFEEGGRPVAMNRLLAARDPVLLDSYAARLIGLDPVDVPYIGLAAGLGVGTDDLAAARITELNDDRSSAGQVRAKELPWRELITENQACSACYGSLVHALERMHERGTLDTSTTRLYIGQYYKHKKEHGIGIGTCTRDFDTFMPGCPPRAADIVAFLEKE